MVDYEPMLEMYMFETIQQIERIEMILLNTERNTEFDTNSTDEIFRIMHSIKGSSAMMMFEGIASLAHALEDLVTLIRLNKVPGLKKSDIVDIGLKSVDFMKREFLKLKEGKNPDGDSTELINKIKEILRQLNIDSNTRHDKKECQVDEKYMKNAKVSNPSEHCYKAIIKFENDCQMENVRAFGIINNLKDIANDIYYLPKDVITNEKTAEIIREKGFEIYFKSDVEFSGINDLLMQTVYLKDLELKEVHQEYQYYLFEDSKKNQIKPDENINEIKSYEDIIKSSMQNTGIISVNVNKLDKLMDLVGELMISSLMVTQNPNFIGPQFNDFKKQANIHNKLIGELQDISMSLRMVPLLPTFSKMNRIIRDASKKLGKEIRLEIIGEETEIDKNIVDSISDPLMHLVRNAVDHGIEEKDERIELGKNPLAVITLEAKNVGGEVWITIRDDGRGMNKEAIYEKAVSKKIISKDFSEMTDDEIYSLVFNTGFSTKDLVTEFSGRGVGLDVVLKNITEIGGSVSISSSKGKGSAFTIKIPLTLAIIGAMIVRVGISRYAIPIMSVSECFRPRSKNIVIDPEGNEMIMVRGECYPIIRLHKIFKVFTNIIEFTEGILIMVENENGRYCIFADELLEELQIVVKPMPNYINKKIKGVSGCTLLGDGSISLIIDLESLSR